MAAIKQNQDLEAVKVLVRACCETLLTSHQSSSPWWDYAPPSDALRLCANARKGALPGCVLLQ
jgi:hypothetical protein